MGNTQSIKEIVRKQPQLCGAIFYFLFVSSKQLYVTYLAEKQRIKKEKVKIKAGGSTSKAKLFSETTDGGVSDLSYAGVIEYWFPSFIRLLESIMMYRMGDRFFTQNGDSGSYKTKCCFVIWIFYSLLPMIDSFLPKDWSNPTEEDQKKKRYLLRFRLPLWVWTACEFYTTYVMLNKITNPATRVTGLKRYLMIIVLATYNGGIGINTSHELIHKHSKFEKLLANLLLLNVNYMHWGNEHLNGHHEHVATPEDPATSRLNESVYSFLPRTYTGTYRSAWDLEMKRLKSAGKSKFNPLENRMVRYAVLPVAWAGILAKLTGGGWDTVRMFYLQGLLSSGLLELVNYIEHYGLTRDKLENGKYEKVNPTHSWNTPHRLSNAVLYKLQRHSDHHTFASRPYHLLRNFQESPNLPAGYPAMIILALFPPAFFWVMNPLVKVAKVKPENFKEDFFEKDQNWLEAEQKAEKKMRLFSTILFGASTGLLYKAVTTAS